jgi:hypothetical protein
VPLLLKATSKKAVPVPPDAVTVPALLNSVP